MKIIGKNVISYFCKSMRQKAPETENVGRHGAIKSLSIINVEQD